MLEKLFISKVRVKILEQYLFNLGEEYHVRGLVRLLNEEINAIRRELQNLEKAEILIPEKKGNKLYYSLNNKNPMIPDLRSMLYKDSYDGEKILSVRDKVTGIEIVLLTNSYITNSYATNIDVDVLFIGEINTKELSNAMKDVERSIHRDLRYAAITKEDLVFRRKNRDAFLLNILEKDKIVLVGTETDLII